MSAPTTEQLVMAAEFAGHRSFVNGARVAIYPPGGPFMSGIHWKPDRCLNQMDEIEEAMSDEQAGRYSLIVLKKALDLIPETVQITGVAMDAVMIGLGLRAPADVRFAAFLEVV